MKPKQRVELVCEFYYEDLVEKVQNKIDQFSDFYTVQKIDYFNMHHSNNMDDNSQAIILFKLRKQQ